MKSTCGCCAGTEGVTPVKTLNRPGLSALVYRVGTHASFLETMKARLSSLSLSVEEFDAGGQPTLAQIKPLLNLTTRDSSDPSIALLDAWAMLADVLTFYQERIANEGYLRTATERLSVLELARLVGYQLRPGVAASVFLAYTLEKDARVTIPAGSRAQSVPGPGELPQSFETSDPLEARAEWNALQPRMSRPQKIDLDNALLIESLTFEGIQTNLKANDPLLLVFGDEEGEQVLRMVETVDAQATANLTRVTLQDVVTPALNEVHKLANRHLKLDRFGLDKDDEVVARVVQEYLLPMRAMKLAQLPQIHPMLAELKEEFAQVNPNSTESLAGWLSSLIEELERVADDVPDTGTVDEGQTGQTQNVTSVEEILAPLQVPASAHPANSLRLQRSASQIFSPNADIVPKLLQTLQPALESSLYQALENANVTEPSPLREIYALRVVAPLFGYNAAPTRPLPFGSDNNNDQFGKPMVAATVPVKPPPLPYDPEWHVVDPAYGPPDAQGVFKLIAKPYEEQNVINLDASYDKILADSWVVIKTLATPVTDAQVLVVKAKATNAAAGRAVYGMSGKTTRIEIMRPNGDAEVSWLNRDLAAIEGSELPIEGDFKAIRTTLVYAQSEPLALAEEPIDPLAEAICDDSFTLDALYEGLEAGRWLIISGERTDIPGVTGVQATELVMLAGVEQEFDPDLPGDSIHTSIRLSTALAYCYKRDTVTIYGNVVKATHGETRSEVIGSGNSGQVMQKFTLKQSPLTYLAAPTPRGAVDTLEVRVNDVLWHEAEDFFNQGPRDHSFVTQADDDDKTTVIFGDGEHGARLPTGVENVTARYRTGIGRAGNAAASQISQLASRPLGVKEVVNPLPATGGADREDRDQGRRNAPMGVMSLDRLVSVQDYEDFARTFAGIAKASAARLSDGQRMLVHLTIAGLNDIPIDPTSDLYLNLRAALLKYGDPSQGLQLALRARQLLVIRARVQVQPDYLWEKVGPKVREALLSAFGFDKRELGQTVYASEVIGVMQAVEGVEYVLLETFDTIPEDASVADLTELADTLTLKPYLPAKLATIDKQVALPSKRIRPAQLIYLSPDVPDTLYLYTS